LRETRHLRANSAFWRFANGAFEHTAASFCSRLFSAPLTNPPPQYLDAVLRQDATFFDHAEPGSVSVMLEDAAVDIQEGLSDKFCAAVQGVFQLIAGFAVAFYFGWQLSLVLCACVPALIGVTYVRFAERTTGLKPSAQNDGSNRATLPTPFVQTAAPFVRTVFTLMCGSLAGTSSPPSVPRTASSVKKLTSPRHRSRPRRCLTSRP